MGGFWCALRTQFSFLFAAFAPNLDEEINKAKRKKKRRTPPTFRQRIKWEKCTHCVASTSKGNNNEQKKRYVCTVTTLLHYPIQNPVQTDSSQLDDDDGDDDSYMFMFIVVVCVFLFFFIFSFVCIWSQEWISSTDHPLVCISIIKIIYAAFVDVYATM